MTDNIDDVISITLWRTSRADRKETAQKRANQRNKSAKSACCSAEISQ